MVIDYASIFNLHRFDLVVSLARKMKMYKYIDCNFTIESLQLFLFLLVIVNLQICLFVIGGFNLYRYTVELS